MATPPSTAPPREIPYGHDVCDVQQLSCVPGQLLRLKLEWLSYVTRQSKRSAGLRDPCARAASPHSAEAICGCRVDGDRCAGRDRDPGNIVPAFRTFLEWVSIAALDDISVFILDDDTDARDVEWSQAQTAQRQRFKRANDCAQAAMAKPDVRAIYENMAAKRKRQPYRLAFSDYFKGKDLLSGRGA